MAANDARNPALPLVGVGCLVALVSWLFGPALLGDRQFGFRDAGHFYYPLYLRVQQEWAAGRWPLWLPEANGGTPLLGNPTAAALYPGKVVYAALPYPWAARVYVVGHVVLAFVAALTFLRSVKVSAAGATVGALAYAFGGPVLFQHANVVFLVGAAWLPFVLWALDSWLRKGCRRAVIWLGVVLAMMILGGDWEAAYLAGVAGVVYALGLSSRPPSFRRKIALTAVVATVYGLHLLLDVGNAPTWVSIPLNVTGWGSLTALLVGRGSGLGRRLAGLAGAGLLAAALSAAQLGPSLEFAQKSRRGAATAETYRFSLKPYALLGALWPNATGTFDRGNRGWLPALPPGRPEPFWVPSLYAGGFVLVLAIGATGFGRSPLRGGLTALTLAALLGSLGTYGSPLLWTRQLPALHAALGSPDPPDLDGPRPDVRPRDFVGSPYWFATAVLPGFGAFRYPAKLLVPALLGLAGLAGLGWDLAVAGATSRARRRGLALLVITITALITLAAGFATWQRLLTDRAALAYSHLGPFDPEGALTDLALGLAHATVVLLAGLALLKQAPGRPAAAGVLAVVLTALDLALANGRVVWTVPQSLFDGPPALARRVAGAERADPSPGPFRVHRLSLRYPEWPRGRTNPIEDVTRWERDTLLFQHGLPFGIDATALASSAELRDHSALFAAFSPPLDPTETRDLGLGPGERASYPPRVSFDAWNTRYFALPDRLAPGDSSRGVGPFLPDTRPVFTPAGAPSADGVRLLKNERAFPRAWVVHRVRTHQGSDTPALVDAVARQNDPVLRTSDGPVESLRDVAWVESAGPLPLALDGGAADPSETVIFDRYEPQRVELRATLHRPGFVVLADTHYPGWTLTVNGRPAEILRTNLLMRGAALPAGNHALVYTYQPRIFHSGLFVSAAAWTIIVGIVLLSKLRRSAPSRYRS